MPAKENEKNAISHILTTTSLSCQVGLDLDASGTDLGGWGLGFKLGFGVYGLVRLLFITAG